MTPAFNPHWPFPQYDEAGRQILPPQPSPAERLQDLARDIGDALM